MMPHLHEQKESISHLPLHRLLYLSLVPCHGSGVFYVASYLPAHKHSYSEGLDTLVPSLGKSYRDGSLKLQVTTNKKLVSHKELTLYSLRSSLLNQNDDIYEGFGNTKKFPEVQKIELMMDLGYFLDDKELIDDSKATLDAMALRGLYDHVGGGFFRYCVDASWETPHFEKMLYNQAELVSLYARAYSQTDKKLYRSVVKETIAMVERRFSKEQLFYSASDADSYEKSTYKVRWRE